jgi:hypothetical protein
VPGYSTSSTIRARLIDRGRFASLQRRRPLRPRPLLLAGVDGAKQAVILEPPGLLAGERPQLPPACGLGPPFAIEKTFERAPERRALQAPDRRIVDPRCRPHGVEQAPIVRRQPCLAAERVELGDRRHVDEHRVDRHRADRRVR